MTTFRSEELLVGLVALALVPLIGRRIVRGVREGQLPLYRTRIDRSAGSSRFNLLLALHALSLVLVALVAIDLLVGLGLRKSL
jgi:hypothetical protein